MLKSKSIGGKIAAARKKSNLSQAQLAREVSISSQAVGKWERGESMPDIITLNRLAEIFAVDLNYFSENFQLVDEDLTSKGTLKNQQVDAPKKANGLSWNMSSGNWVGADFSNLNNLTGKFSSSNMKNCKFRSSDLSGLNLDGNDIKDCDFSNSNLRNCKIKSSELLNNNFSGCSLIDTEFYNSEIVKCNFSGADLSGAEFTSINFEKSKTEDTNWKLVSFKLSQISDITFHGLIEDCSFENCAFSNTTFKNSKILNTFFKGKKLKGIKFIECQADRMTYEFLKNGKADLTGLTLIS